MKDTERNFLSQQLKTSQEFLDRFFEFRQNARIQLLSNQLQHFQSIAGISLAIIAALLATGSIAISLWWILTGSAALLLVIYASAHTREANDSWDKGLNKEEKSLNQIHEDLEKVILNAVKFDSYSIYESYVMDKGKPAPTNPSPSYAGEIAVFLFLITIFLGIVALIDKHIHIGNLLALPLVLGGILLCFTVSTCDWNLALTERISRFLDRILRKPVS